VECGTVVYLPSNSNVIKAVKRLVVRIFVYELFSARVEQLLIEFCAGFEISHPVNIDHGEVPVACGTVVYTYIYTIL
jgi:hypothetical protein